MSCPILGWELDIPDSNFTLAQGIIATLVQLFFAWRVKVLTGRMWVVMIIVVSAMGSICGYFSIADARTILTCFSVGGVGTAIAIHYVPEFVQFQKFQAIVIVWLILAAICDLTITISLTLHLVSLISRRHHLRKTQDRCLSSSLLAKPSDWFYSNR